MPKVMVKTIVRETMNAAAEAKTGWQRAATHSSNGNSMAMGTTVFQGAGGRKTMTPVIPASATSAAAPSTSSLRGGGLCMAAASPIISGAIVRMPSRSDANQSYQVVRNGPPGYETT